MSGPISQLVKGVDSRYEKYTSDPAMKFDGEGCTYQGNADQECSSYKDLLSFE